MRDLSKIASRVAKRVTAGMETKYFLVEAPDLKPVLVVVDDSEAQTWFEERRYLADTVPLTKIVELEVWKPGDLSDKLAPRDE